MKNVYPGYMLIFHPTVYVSYMEKQERINDRFCPTAEKALANYRDPLKRFQTRFIYQTAFAPAQMEF